MTFNPDEKIKEDAIASTSMSEKQKDIVYRETILPIRAKIAEILLYDTDSALKFLERYNDIVKNEEDLGIDIVSEMAKLELEIYLYKQEQGNLKEYKEQSNVLMQKITELEENFEQLSLDELKQELLNIKQIHQNNLSNYSYSDRDKMEQHIYGMQAKYIIRKVTNEDVLDLHSEISQEDEAMLTMILNNKVFSLIQSENLDEQAIGKEIQYKMIDRTDAIYDVGIWQMLGIGKKEEKQIVNNRETAENNPNLLPTIKSKRTSNMFNMIFGFFNKNILKVGILEMKIADTIQIGDTTIPVKDLSKISIEWLAEQVSEDMLKEIEDKRLSQEGRNFKERYMPDSRMPIYEFFSNIKEKYKVFEFEYYDEGESKSKVYIENDDGVICDINVEGVINYELNMNLDNMLEFINIAGYAELIDNITNSNIQEQLFNEMGILIQKIALQQDDYFKYDYDKRKKLVHKLPILNSLLKSYKREQKQFRLTRMDVYTEDEQKRNEFYKKYKFKKNLQIDEDVIAETNKLLKEVESYIDPEVRATFEKIEAEIRKEDLDSEVPEEGEEK